MVGPAVAGLEGDVGHLRNKDFVADAPGSLTQFRTGGAHLAAGTIDRDAAHQVGSGAFGVGRGLHAGADQDVAARPAFDGNAAVGARIDADAPDGGDAQLADFAMARAVAVPVIVIADELFLSVVLELGK